MTAEDLYQRIAQAALHPQARYDGWRMFDAEVAAFAQLPPLDASRLLMRVAAQLDQIGRRFVAELARAPDPERAALPAFLRASLYFRGVSGGLDLLREVVDAAWPRLDAAMRGAIHRQCPELVATQAPIDREPWPDDDDFPALATEEGRRARLRYLGYAAADIDSGAALVLFQLERDCAELGVWDAPTLDALEAEADARMLDARVRASPPH